MESAIRITPENITPDDTAGDEYYYGYRTIIEHDENGECSFSYRPLTFEDLLDPEEGDVYMQGNLHTDDIERLRSIFRFHLKDRGNMTVYSDMKIDWGIENLSNPAPDISILADVNEPEKPRGIFYVTEEGVKPFFILEVVSPRYRKADIESKPEIYRRAGVSEYIIVDPGLKNNVISYTIDGYRLIGTRYVKIKPDSHGQIKSLTTGVSLSVSESGDKLIVTDTRTGQEILPDRERAEQEKAKAVEAKIIAEQEKAKAVEAKIIAEQEKKRADIAEEELRLLKLRLKESVYQV